MESEEQTLGYLEEKDPLDDEEVDPDVDPGVDPGVVDDALSVLPEEVVEAGDTSLEALRDPAPPRRPTRTPPDEVEDEDEFLTFGPEPDEPTTVDIPASKVTPIRDEQEFVCSNCHLVKARVQLADEARGLCRDCV